MISRTIWRKILERCFCVILPQAGNARSRFHIPWVPAVLHVPVTFASSTPLTRIGHGACRRADPVAIDVASVAQQRGLFQGGRVGWVGGLSACSNGRVLAYSSRFWGIESEYSRNQPQFIAAGLLPLQAF